MNVYICDNFQGHYPVGTAAVIVAATKEEAEFFLRHELKKQGLPQVDSFGRPIELNIHKVDTRRPMVDILCNGNY